MAKKKTKKKDTRKLKLENRGEYLGTTFAFVLMMIFYIINAFTATSEMIGVISVAIIGAYTCGLFLYEYIKNKRLIYLIGTALGLALAIYGSYWLFNL